MWKRVALISLVSALGGSPAWTQELPGTASGQEIGMIIKTAIITAIPGVEEVLNLIWRDRRPKDKIKRDDLKKMIEAAREEMRAQFISEAREQLALVNQVAEELRIIKHFLEDSLQAHHEIIRMRSLLSAARAASPEGIPRDADIWAELSEPWQVAKKSLERVANFDSSELDQISSLWLRDQLSRILELTNEAAIRVENRLNNKDSDRLMQYLDNVSLVLDKIGAAAGYKIADLGADLKDLATWAQPKALGYRADMPRIEVPKLELRGFEKSVFRRILSNEVPLGER